MIKEVREQRYVGAIFRYGIVAVLLVLEEHEAEDNFEECQIILDAINFVNKYTFAEEDEVLPTKYSSKVLADLKSHFNLFGFTGDIAINNMPEYVRQVKIMINK